MQNQNKPAACQTVEAPVGENFERKLLSWKSLVSDC